MHKAGVVDDGVTRVVDVLDLLVVSGVSVADLVALLAASVEGLLSQDDEALVIEGHLLVGFEFEGGSRPKEGQGGEGGGFHFIILTERGFGVLGF